MPSSRIETVPSVINLVIGMNPEYILDVGSGFGKFGFLLREYLECWQGRLFPGDWTKRIDAVEIFARYAELPWYEDLYDHVFVMNVLDMNEVIPAYDLVLLCDVIEHLPRDSGRKVLDISSKYIVTTPNYDSTQGTCFGNPAEAHISRWGREDFANSKVVDGIIVGWKT